jgi:hypothetical protein
MLHIIWIIKNKSQSDLNLACENKGGKLEKKRMNIKENKEHCAWALFLTLSPTTSWAKFSIRGPSRLTSSLPQPLLAACTWEPLATGQWALAVRFFPNSPQVPLGLTEAAVTPPAAPATRDSWELGAAPCLTRVWGPLASASPRTLVSRLPPRVGFTAENKNARNPAPESQGLGESRGCCDHSDPPRGV